MKIYVSPDGHLFVERSGHWTFVGFEEDGNHWLLNPAEAPDAQEMETLARWLPADED